MKDSCVKTGFHRNNVGIGEETINYDRIMTRTLDTKATKEELSLMKEKRYIVAQKFLDTGSLKFTNNSF